MPPLLRTGYDFDQTFLVELDGIADTGLASATFTACVKDYSKRLEVITDTTATLVSAPAGTVRVQFPASKTGSLGNLVSSSPATIGQIMAGRAFIELAVVIAGIRYPVADCEIVVEYGMALT